MEIVFTLTDVTPIPFLGFVTGSQGAWALTDVTNSFLVEFQYPQGPPGASAYEIAVSHGYTGTEEEWLVFLQGGSSGEVSTVVSMTGELVAPTITFEDGSPMISWDIVGYTSGGESTIRATSGELIQMIVTTGDEGEKYVEWKILGT